MLNKMKSTILYSKVQSAIYDAERTVKETTKKTVNSVKNPDNLKKAAKTTVAAATIISAANTGACVGVMIVDGVSKKAVASTAVHALKTTLYKNAYKCMDEADKAKKENK